jgi:hypothetical protein
MNDDFDLKVDVDKYFDLDVDVKLDIDADVELTVDKDIDVTLDLCYLQGNAAVLVADVQAFGDNSLTELTTAILVTDDYSSITVEAGAYVN